MRTGIVILMFMAFPLRLTGALVDALVGGLDLTWSGANPGWPLALEVNALEFDGLRRGSFVENNNLSTGSMPRATIPPFDFFIATFRETWLVPFV